MKNYIFAIFVFVSSIGFGQKDLSIDLNWKIKDGEIITYSAFHGAIDTSLVTSKQETVNEGHESAQKYNEYIQNSEKTISLIGKKNDIIEITMSHKAIENQKTKKKTRKKTKPDEFEESMTSLLYPDILLRGAVYKNGEIKSFWVKNDQKNSIALLFELPSRAVQINDKWSLDVNFISNDQNFKCDSAFKKNSVSLEDIKITESDTIAILRYDIIEFVSGEFDAPNFFGQGDGTKEITMSVRYEGLAEFSINKGKWVNYNCSMTSKLTGYRESFSKQRYCLTIE